MDKENTLIQMEIFMKVNGKMTIEMVKGKKLIIYREYMKVNG